jgi:hypothetical protein
MLNIRVGVAGQRFAIPRSPLMFRLSSIYPSCPAVSRASIAIGTSALDAKDGRVKPGHDDGLFLFSTTPAKAGA